MIASPTSNLDTRQTPISLIELKDQLRIEHSDQDRMLLSKIKGATYEAERYIGGPIVERSMTLTLPVFVDEIVLLPGPAISIVSFSYYDGDNVQQSLTSTDYELYKTNGISKLKAVADWPSIYDRTDAISIVYNAGVATAPTFVPQDIKEAVLMRAATRYTVSEESGLGTVAWNIENDLNAERLLMPYKVLSC